MKPKIYFIKISESFFNTLSSNINKFNYNLVNDFNIYQLSTKPLFYGLIEKEK